MEIGRAMSLAPFMGTFCGGGATEPKDKDCFMQVTFHFGPHSFLFVKMSYLARKGNVFWN